MKRCLLRRDGGPRWLLAGRAQHTTPTELFVYSRRRSTQTTRSSRWGTRGQPISRGGSRPANDPSAPQWAPRHGRGDHSLASWLIELG